MSNIYTNKEWPELEVGNDGDATQVPVHLQALAKADCPRWQHTLKLKALYDDGEIFSAAGKAIPEIVTLIQTDATPNKDTLLVLLAETLCGGTQTRMVWGLDMSRPEIQSFYGGGVAKDVWESTWSSRALYLTLLDHADEKVRSAAAFLLAFDFEGAGEVQAKLESLILKEQNSKTKASMLLCLGLARQYAPTHPRQLKFATVADDTTHELSVRAAAIVGLLYESSEPVALSNYHKAILVDASALVKIDHNGYPWNGGVIDMHISRVVEGRCEEGGLVAAEILAECINQYGVNARSHEWARGILALALPRAEKVQTTSSGSFIIDASIFELSQFTDRQRALLEALASYSFVAPFQSYGIPVEVADRRRWAGLEAPGPMEQIVEVEILGKLQKWPVWKCLKEQQASNPNYKVDVDALLGKVLTPLQLLEVWIDYSYDAYSLRLAGDVDEKVREHSHEMLPWARNYLNYMSRIFREFGGAVSGGTKASAMAMDLLIEQAGAEEILPEYDVLMNPTWYSIYQHFDLARREKFILDHLKAYFLTNENAFWSAKDNILTTLANLKLFPTETVANVLFDLRDHIVANFKEFADVRRAIETECLKYVDLDKEFAKVVEKRLTPQK